ncbi:unnamed protein product [Brassica rapa subsp. narinosa]
MKIIPPESQELTYLTALLLSPKHYRRIGQSLLGIGFLI